MMMMMMMMTMMMTRTPNRTTRRQSLENPRNRAKDLMDGLCYASAD